MNTPTHEFVTVDMRGLKSALVARAQTDGVSVSVVVRRAVERELGFVGPGRESEAGDPDPDRSVSIVKLSIRLTNNAAEQLEAGSRRAGLSRGAFLAELLAGVPALVSTAGSRQECIAALTASSAELSTLTRSINRLTTLLEQGEVQAARQYRSLLDTLADDVRVHLRLTADVLANLQPCRVAKQRRAPQSRRKFIT